MRILVHEYASGGGFAGRNVPRSLAREGSAMRAALVADLAAIGEHQIVTTADSRFPLKAPPGLEVVTLSPRSSKRVLDQLISSADAVWLIAPETGRILERLAARVENRGKTLLGSGSAAIRRASDKAGLPRILARHGILHPPTHVFSAKTAREIGYPMVVKPARGAGCEGVRLVRNVRELRQALGVALEADPRGRALIQRYVPGMAASVSLLADGRRAVALTVNSQCMRTSRPFSYRGGRTPLEHPLAQRAAEAAVRACEALPGLCGYVGVDLVLTKSEPVVIEVNPRLTTAYLGVRSVMDANVAAMVLAACEGALPTPPPLRRSVHFSAAGVMRSGVARVPAKRVRGAGAPEDK